VRHRFAGLGVLGEMLNAKIRVECLPMLRNVAQRCEESCLEAADWMVLGKEVSLQLPGIDFRQICMRKQHRLILLSSRPCVRRRGWLTAGRRVGGGCAVSSHRVV